MIRKILKLNSEILRKPTDVVTDFDFDFQILIDDMIETMRKANGIGLAAPQVGISKKLIVLEFEGDKDSELKSFPLTVLANPKIVSSSKRKKNMVEGCLSFPGLEVLVKRPANVTVKGQDRYGKPTTIKATDLYARVVQHEIDHLNSTLLIDHIKETPVIFIGTGTLGVPSLQALIADPQYKVKLVITGNLKATSRSHKEKSINPIEQIANSAKLPVLVTDSINSENVINRIKRAKPKLGIMADFGQIVGEQILAIPKYGVINIHPSLLPLHRGPSPIQETILSGDKITGVTLILAVRKMDAGPIISQVSIRLSNSETSTILKDYLGRLGASLLLNSIPYYLAGDLEPVAQDDAKATYTRLFQKNDGYVDQNTSAEVVEKKVRAFDAWPKVFTKIKDMQIQIVSAHFGENGEFVIDRVKPEGRNEMSYNDFVNGYRNTLTFKQ